jgi:hypothetical protein
VMLQVPAEEHGGHPATAELTLERVTASEASFELGPQLRCIQLTCSFARVDGKELRAERAHGPAQSESDASGEYIPRVHTTEKNESPTRVLVNSGNM